MPKAVVQSMVTPDQRLMLPYNEDWAAKVDRPAKFGLGRPTSLVVIYSCGDYRAASPAVRSDDLAAKPIEITRKSVST